MIELMLYENQGWFFLGAYWYLCFLICKVVRDSVNQLEESIVNERYDDFMIASRQSNIDNLHRRVEKGDFSYIQMQDLVSRIKMFSW